MASALIGHTGFVGQNIAKQINFSDYFNSINIGEIRGGIFDTVVCAGVRAEKWMANLNPEKDRKSIFNLLENLSHIHCNRFILISTIDVYDIKTGVDEEHEIDEKKTDYYGRHRLEFEKEICLMFPNLNIIRLPGLFGVGLKKNFIFDILHPVPGFLSEKVLNLLLSQLDSKSVETIKKKYTQIQGNIFKLSCPRGETKLREIFASIKFSSLNFTDSRSEFQFYNLEKLSSDISWVVNNKIPLVNLNAAPVSASKIIEYIRGEVFLNELPSPPIRYDIKSKYAEEGSSGYFSTKHDILDQLKEFVTLYRSGLGL